MKCENEHAANPKPKRWHRKIAVGDRYYPFYGSYKYVVDLGFGFVGYRGINTVDMNGLSAHSLYRSVHWNSQKRAWYVLVDRA